jgi:catechol 2,3-dioxygenase-like lactoylglutathione lyase family enzyme
MTPPGGPAPAISHVLETALYVDDLAAAVAFYRDVLGLAVLDASARLVSFDAGRSSVLLLFQRGATLEPVETAMGRIPAHDGHGRVHVAFAIAADHLAAWDRHLAACGVAIESRMRWERGGQSIYFRDPAGHSVELVTPGTWTIY